MENINYTPGECRNSKPLVLPKLRVLATASRVLEKCGDFEGCLRKTVVRIIISCVFLMHDVCMFLYERAITV